jgi:hypothetical protein
MAGSRKRPRKRQIIFGIFAGVLSIFPGIDQRGAEILDGFVRAARGHRGLPAAEPTDGKPPFFTMVGARRESGYGE